MKEYVKDFMAGTGSLPSSINTKQELLDLLKPYVFPRKDGKAGLLAEEVWELTEAVKDGDVQEILDAVTDCQYFLDQIKIYLEIAGVDVEAAEDLVCYNNQEKYSTDFNYVQAKYIEWEHNDPWFFQQLRIAESKVNGVSYYCLKDGSNKVRKFVDFPKVDLSKCVPEDLK